jgi:arginine exporter protein ArgO
MYRQKFHCHLPFSAVADSVLTKWQGTPLQIAMLCVAIVAFIGFFLLIYFASKNLMDTMEKEHEAEEAKTEVEARLNSNVDENSNQA